MKKTESEKRKKKLLWQVPFLIVLIVGTVLIIRQQNSQPYQQEEGMVFGTFYRVSYQYDRSLKPEIEVALKTVDAEFSMFNDTSTVSRLNRGEQPQLSDDFIEVAKLALRVAEDTDGAFDITVAPLVNAWGFGFKNEQMPTRQQVDSLLQLTGWQKLKLDTAKRQLTKADKRMMLDFSAIAKGYGSDAVARVMREHGIKNFMIEIGGEMVTQGISPKRLPWRIGVTKPVDDSLSVREELQTVLNLTDCALATSGNYRNFYCRDGKKYAHTIDPKTGYPVQHSVLSATVITDDCATADAYATSIMVLGLDGATTLLERHPELKAYLIYAKDDGSVDVWFSPSLKDKIEE